MTRSIKFIALAVSLSATTFASAQAGATTAALDQGPALKTIIFNNQCGMIRVLLPSDVVVGETLSGTVMVDPFYGRSKEEYLGNKTVLEGCVVDISGTELHADKPKFRWTVPATLGPAGALISLRNFYGPAIASQCIPIAPTSVLLSVNPDQKGYLIPFYGSVYQPIQIRGQFDGESANTSVRVNGAPASILAESNRQTVVSNNADATGPGTISVTEGETKAQGTYNTIQLELSAPKTNLRKGEDVTVTMKLTGLKGLPSQAFPIKTEVTNLSPDIIDFGNNGVFVSSVLEGQVSPEGIATKTAKIKAIQAGAFSISSTVFSAAIPKGAMFANLSFWEKAARWISDRDWDVGPSLDDLIAKLKDLRDRKAYDHAHGNKYQRELAAEIEKIKKAMRTHHGRDGEKAAMNEPGDYDPPRQLLSPLVVPLTVNPRFAGGSFLPLGLGPHLDILADSQII